MEYSNTFNPLNIYINQIDSSFGYYLVEVLRKDHLSLENCPSIYGSLCQNKQNRYQLHESVCKAYDFYSQRQFCVRRFLEADLVFIDFRDEVSEEINFLLEIMKNYQKSIKKHKRIVGISNFMTWAGSPDKKFKNKPQTKENYLEFSQNSSYWEKIFYRDSQFPNRIPHPLYNDHYTTERKILDLNDNKCMDSWIFCTGMVYGQNSQLLEQYIDKALSCQNQTVYNPECCMPFIHIDKLMNLFQEFVDNQQRFSHLEERYLLVCEEQCPLWTDFLRKLNLYVGNKRPIIYDNQFIYNKKIAPYNVRVNFQPSIIVQQLLNLEDKRIILDDIGKLVEEYLDHFQFQFSRFLIEQELLGKYPQKNMRKLFQQKFCTIDKDGMNKLANQMLEKGQITSQESPIEEFKTTNKRNCNSQTLTKEPYQMYFQSVFTKFLTQNKYVNFVLVLKQELINKIFQGQFLNRQLSSNKFIRIIDEQQIKNQLTKTNCIRVFSQIFSQIFGTQQRIKKQLKQEQKVSQSQHFHKQPYQPLDEPLIQQQEKEQTQNTKNINKINLISQYLLDNFVVYVAEAKQKIQQKRIITNNTNLRDKTILQAFLEELKLIKSRETKLKQMQSTSQKQAVSEIKK